MRINDIAFLAIRLLAIYLFIQAASLLPSSISMLVGQANSQDPSMISNIALGALASGLMIVVVSGILWTGSGWLANYMTKGLHERTETKEELNPRNLYLVGITILGLFIVVSTVPSFLKAISYFISPEKGGKSETLNALSPIVKMIIGCMFAFKTETVVARLRR